MGLVGACNNVLAKDVIAQIQLSDRIELLNENNRVKYKFCQLSECSTIGKNIGYSKAEIEKIAMQSVASEEGNTPSASVSQLISDGYSAAQGNEEIVAEFLTPFEGEIGPLVSVFCPFKKEIVDKLAKAGKSKNRSDYLFEMKDYKEAGCGAFMEDNPGRVLKIVEGLKKYLK